MAGLVADYGSESESEDSNSIQSPTNISNEIILPKPNFASSSEDGIKERSVFINPFVEADNAKTAILEKHVKMTSTDVKTVSGKKICWNYRKNRCRFGHNCKFAHDSDLQTDKSTILASEAKIKQNCVKNIAEPILEESAIKKNKRPGMSKDIISCKKVLKVYKEQKISQKL